MKVQRKIIEIDEELCDGCGQCVPSCAEGALEIIDGKAKVIADIYCDGLGACLGECPVGALKVIEREADEFDDVPAPAPKLIAASRFDIVPLELFVPPVSVPVPHAHPAIVSETTTPLLTLPATL